MIREECTRENKKYVNFFSLVEKNVRERGKEREREVQGLKRGRACLNLGKSGQIPLPRGTDPYNHLTLVLRPGEVMICSQSRLSQTQSCTNAGLAHNI